METRATTNEVLNKRELAIGTVNALLMGTVFASLSSGNLPRGSDFLVADSVDNQSTMTPCKAMLS